MFCANELSMSKDVFIFCYSENCHQHTDFQMSRLFAVTIFDAPGDLDQRLEAAHRFDFVSTIIDFEKRNSEKP